MRKIQIKVNSIVGPLYLVASEQGLQGVYWDKQSLPMASGRNDPLMALLQSAERQLQEYFERKRRKFDLLLDYEGTDFQKKVWEQLLKIPYGQTRSYKEIALELNNGKACRAVGTANGRNPLSIIVPCHRVISSDGTLGGYAGGLKIKEKLLHLEKSRVK